MKFREMSDAQLMAWIDNCPCHPEYEDRLIAACIEYENRERFVLPHGADDTTPDAQSRLQSELDASRTEAIRLRKALNALVSSRWLSIDFDHNRTREAVALRQEACEALDYDKPPSREG